jgi:hypothetical protein
MLLDQIKYKIIWIDIGSPTQRQTEKRTRPPKMLKTSQDEKNTSKTTGGLASPLSTIKFGLDQKKGRKNRDKIGNKLQKNNNT